MIPQLLNGITYGSLLLVMALGLALIFGLRGIFNFGHGALYMLGAYLAYSLTTALNFWAALLIVPLLLGLLGFLVDAGAFRHLQNRDPIELAIITYGGALIIGSVVRLIWGSGTKAISPPSQLIGSVSIFGNRYPSYRLFLVAISLVVASGIALWLRYSKTGLFVRAASFDGQTTAILGVNTDRLNAIVATVSFGLAGLAGVLAAPYLVISTDMGIQILVTSLIVITIGGLGSITGAVIAAVLLGLVQVFGDVSFPAISPLTPYIALVAIIIWRPTGIAGRSV